MNRKINLTFRRFEFKYQIPKDTADLIIPMIKNYMTWDEYTDKNEYYEVNSLYYDTPSFECYHDKIDGVMNRKKFRIRAYNKDVTEDSKLFFEIKRKSDEVILKDRIVVQGKDFLKFPNDAFCLLKNKEYDQGFLNEFLFETQGKMMKPVILVTYKRKPFFSKFDRRFRVTLDYDLSITKPKGVTFQGDYQDIYPDTVILEVKFNGAMPKWFHDIIETYKMTKRPFSKYCEGIEAYYGLPSYF